MGGQISSLDRLPAPIHSILMNSSANPYRISFSNRSEIENPKNPIPFP